jgi:hypothetical protein
VNINDISESPIDPDVQSELQQFEADSRAMLGLAPDVVEPDDIIRAIHDYVDGLRAGVSYAAAGAAGYSSGDQMLLLACLWGIQICRKLNWEWADLSVHGDTYQGIVSPAREYAIFPFDYMRQVVTAEEGKENTCLLVYNMLKAGSFSPQEPRSYQVLQ